MKVKYTTYETNNYNLKISGDDTLIISGGDNLVIPAIKTTTIETLYTVVPFSGFVTSAIFPGGGGSQTTYTSSVDSLITNTESQLVISGGDKLVISGTLTQTVSPFPTVIELPSVVAVVEV